MHCAECGYLMSDIKCCNGFGYWYDRPPLPQDYIKLRTSGKWYLYISANWPRGLKIVEPQLKLLRKSSNYQNSGASAPLT